MLEFIEQKMSQDKDIEMSIKLEEQIIEANESIERLLDFALSSKMNNNVYSKKIMNWN